MHTYGKYATFPAAPGDSGLPRTTIELILMDNTTYFFQAFLSSTAVKNSFPAHGQPQFPVNVFLTLKLRRLKEVGS